MSLKKLFETHTTSSFLNTKKLLLLKTNMKAGHGGSSGRFEYLKEIALDYAFLFKMENIIE